MNPSLKDAISLVFEGRSRNGWSDRPVPDELLHRIYDLMKMGPTSLNSSPARLRFIVSKDAKEKLLPHLSESNRAKSMAAPCVAIVAYDEAFYDQMPALLPSRPALRDMFAGNDALARSTAFRNSTLQGAYLMVAARLCGLDCGPMSGFDAAGIEGIFFAGTRLRANFLCALGYADDQPFPRLPRLSFNEAAEIL